MLLSGESSYLKLKALTLWVRDSSLDRIHDEKVASIAAQKLTNLIKISRKWHQLEIRTIRFRYGTIWKRHNASEKTRSVSQKKKKK